MTNFEKKIKRLSRRDWADLRSFWLNHIPEIESPGQEPGETLDQDERLRQEVSLLGRSGERRFEPDVSPASQLFRESIFVVCKAVRVSCEAARQADGGLPTWSISTAHHGAIFALRGFLGLCGIAYLEIDNQFLLMDVRPGEPKGRRKKSSVSLVDTNEVQLFKVPKMQHREWWSVYQRILNTSAETFNCWRYPVGRELGLCRTGVLSRHRNDLHYRLVWFDDDLLEEKVIPSFGRFSGEAADRLVDKLEEDNGSDGAIILNQILLGNSLAMLEDLGRSSRQVKGVVDTISGTIEHLMNDIVATWYRH